MKTSDVVYFSLVYDDALESMDSAAIAADTYGGLVLFSCSREYLELYRDYISSQTTAPVKCFHLMKGWALDSIVSFVAYLTGKGEAKVIKVDLTSGIEEEESQFIRSKLFYHNSVSEVTLVQNSGLHPSVKKCLQNIISEVNQLTYEINRFLTGESYFSQAHLESHAKNDCDIDNLKLEELRKFLGSVSKLRGRSQHIGEECHKIEKELSNLLTKAPLDYSCVMHSSASGKVVDSYPCVYKVYSALNYMAYKNSLSRGLFNKSFIYLFRCYEYYLSGLLILHKGCTKAKIDSSGKYRINNGSPRGFGEIYIEAGKLNGLGTLSDYFAMDTYRKFRNKQAFTHGDLKANKDLVISCDRAVTSQIIYLEKSSFQKSFRWDFTVNEVSSLLLFDCVELTYELAVRHFNFRDIDKI